MPNCNSYGWSGGFAALSAAIAWVLYQDKRCVINFAKLLTTDNLNQDHLQVFHYIAIVVGIVLFVLSFFDFASILSEITVIFIAAVVGIFVVGTMMLYSVYMDYYLVCGNNILSTFTQSNVFDGSDTVGITVLILDLIAGLLLISAAISFSRTY